MQQQHFTMPTNYIEIAPVSSPPRKRKRTDSTIASPTTMPVPFHPAIYPFMFPGHPAYAAQWMAIPPPVFGVGSPQPLKRKAVGYCTITKVGKPSQSADATSPLQQLIAQVDAITPPVKKQPTQTKQQINSKQSPSAPKQQETLPGVPIVIEPISEKKRKECSKSVMTPENEIIWLKNAFDQLRPKVSMQHTVLLHDLQALQETNKDHKEVNKVCVEYSTAVTTIETQRSHALLVAIDIKTRQSIEVHYDQKRLELIESAIKTLTKLKPSVNIPAAWSAPTHGLPLLSYVTQSAQTETKVQESTVDFYKENTVDSNKEVITAFRKRAGNMANTYAILNQWYEDFRDCPYASNEDISELSQKTGLTVSQVRKWLGNRRLRDKDSKVRLRKYDSKIILSHLRRRNKQKKEQLQQQQQQEQEQQPTTVESTSESSEAAPLLKIKIESVSSLA